MCDFRNIIAVVIDGKEISAEIVGGNHSFDFEPEEAGIYHIGASGCGLYYWSGSEWYSDYDSSWCQPCKFITDGSMDLLIDIKNFDI